MTTLFHILLAFHILAAGLALVVAPGGMVTVKGGRWRRRWGKIFVAAMFVVATTAAAMSVLHPNLFLFMVAIFSFILSSPAIECCTGSDLGNPLPRSITPSR